MTSTAAPHLLNQAHSELADPLIEDVLPPALVDREGHTPAGPSLCVVLRREEGTEDGLTLLRQLLPNDVPQTTRSNNASNQASHYTHHSLTLHTLQPHTTPTTASHYTQPPNLFLSLEVQSYSLRISCMA